MKKVKKLNKLKERINKLCPNGVKFEELKEICMVINGFILIREILLKIRDDIDINDCTLSKIVGKE